MIAYDEALKLVRATAEGRALSVETRPLPEAAGRIVAQPLDGNEAVPGFDNSAMDGFAVQGAQVAGASAESPVTLPVGGLVVAGDSGELGKVQGAVEIMTGAPMPSGPFDTVLRVEDVAVERSADGRALQITVRKPAKLGDNVRRRGEDYQPGQRVLEAGTRLRPEDLMALAGLGLWEVPLLRRPRVALIATGRELVPADTQTLAPGMIRNSTTPYLLTALTALGAEARFVGTVRDEPEVFARLLAEALEARPDVLLTTGAVSMGKHDFVGEELQRAGAKVRFHKVAIRPGKPLLLAELEKGPVVFGIPGNPVSTAVGLRFFVEPYLRRLQGLEAERTTRARLVARVKKPSGLRCFYKARLQVGVEGARVEVLAGQASFMVRTLTEANAWAVLGEEGDAQDAGSEIEVFPMLPEHGA